MDPNGWLITGAGAWHLVSYTWICPRMWYARHVPHEHCDSKCGIHRKTKNMNVQALPVPYLAINPRCGEANNKADPPVAVAGKASIWVTDPPMFSCHCSGISTITQC